MNDDSGKQAVVLSGGGAYAAYEVGVMKALFSGLSPATNFQPLDPDYLVGSSAGAMNAMAIAAHDEHGLVESVARLENVWLNRIAEDTQRCGNGIYRIRGLPAEFLDPNCYQEKPLGLFADVAEDAIHFLRSSFRVAADLLDSSQSVMQRIVRSINLSALVSTEPFIESIKTFIPIDGVRRSRRFLRIVATNLNTGKLNIFTERDVDRYGYGPLLASTALPAFFPPLQLGGENYIDGSTLANTPLLPAIAEADSLHLVYQDPELNQIARERLQNTVDVIDRTLVVHFAFAFGRDINLARQTNEAIELVDGYGEGSILSAMQLHTFLRIASRLYRRIEAGRPYRKLTIHRYHPRDDLGETLGLMNLNYDKLRRVIQRGFDDAVNHDCEQSGCVLPEGPTIVELQRPRSPATSVIVPVDPPFRTPDPATIQTIPPKNESGIRTPNPAPTGTIPTNPARAKRNKFRSPNAESIRNGDISS